MDNLGIWIKEGTFAINNLYFSPQNWDTSDKFGLSAELVNKGQIISIFVDPDHYLKLLTIYLLDKRKIHCEARISCFQLNEI